MHFSVSTTGLLGIEVWYNTELIVLEYSEHFERCEVDEFYLWLAGQVCWWEFVDGNGSNVLLWPAPLQAFPRIVSCFYINYNLLYHESVTLAYREGCPPETSRPCILFSIYSYCAAQYRLLASVCYTSLYNYPIPGNSYIGSFFFER